MYLKMERRTDSKQSDQHQEGQSGFDSLIRSHDNPQKSECYSFTPATRECGPTQVSLIG